MLAKLFDYLCARALSITDACAKHKSQSVFTGGILKYLREKGKSLKMYVSAQNLYEKKPMMSRVGMFYVH